MKRDISKTKTNVIASRHLGSSGSYGVQTDKFDPSLLVKIPRSEARGDWGITGSEFVGYDVWHCHESTFLLENGYPIAGTLKFKYPSYSECIVESKSMKLYLNSFDMCKINSQLELAVFAYELQIKNDLEELLGVDVDVCFHQHSIVGMTAQENNPFLTYPTLESYFNIEELNPFDDYTSKGDYPIVGFGVKEERKYYRQTNVLRSKCRHTKQKDTGTFFGYFKGEFHLSDSQLFKKIVSLRELDEFHEFCCEKLFVDIVKEELVSGCMIALLYSRRGSLDINPIRATSFDLIPEKYIDVKNYSPKTFGQ